MATDTLTAKQHKAIAALLSESTVKQAAEKIGVGERTVHTWLAESAFDAAYRKARREAVRQAVARLQQTSTLAVTVLLSLMADKKTPAAVRLSAASKILDTALKALEVDDLEARIRALEATYAQS